MAGLIAVSLLVAGCSQGVDGNAERIQPVPSTSAATTPARPSTAPPTSTRPAQPPQPGAPMGDVITWIEAGRPADAGAYHSATRDGATTELGDDVAFTTPSGKTNCMTDSQHRRRRAGMPGRPRRSSGATTGGLRRVEGRLGRLRGPERWKSARPTVIRVDSPTGPVPNCRTARRWSSAITVPRRSRRPVLRQPCAPDGGPVQRRRDRTVRLPADGHAPPRRSARCSAADL